MGALTTLLPAYTDWMTDGLDGPLRQSIRALVESEAIPADLLGLAQMAGAALSDRSVPDDGPDVALRF